VASYKLTILTAFTALALTGSASANNVDPGNPSDSSAYDSITRSELDCSSRVCVTMAAALIRFRNRSMS